MTIKSKASLVSAILLLLANCMQHYVNGQQVPCFFIFGDSLCDNGNNNKLRTAAKSNYNPYGIDFPGGPSGRFTNGQNLVDYIAQLLEFSEYIPPFANTSGSDILKGVNHASGAAGILFETGKRLGENVHLEEQLKNHKAIYLKIARELGGLREAKEYLNQCITVVNAPCCPTRDDGQCVLNGTPCPNRNQYLFYDGYHITQLVHQLFAIGTYDQIQPLIHH
ncbi:GDSL esterase/lipase [Vigna angularis]|uniref:GDSL esterase/lipase n=1 Tax=Phaseolus angularis TaxID=3914 RepID=A0A8T0KBL9_PHAAN|nr:GDSL esterase/lipase [Vigna angularis]